MVGDSPTPAQVACRGRAWIWAVAACCVVMTAPGRAGGDALALLRERTDLTPERLVRLVGDFRFELRERVQDPAVFLERKCGDCDDFARLAATLLADRGYKTKLVVIMMEKQTHVVCYVKEAGGFLDFNRRGEAKPVVASGGTLEEIADQVAAYFRSRWRMASEFKYQENSPVFLDSVFPAARASARSQPVQTPRTASASSPGQNTSRASFSEILGVK